MGVLSQQRLWVVSGKGGVGKSTVAAALALASERITYLLERPEAGAEPRQLEQNLWAVNVQPAEAMREYALMVLRFQAVYRAVFENRFVRYFLRFIPSLQELVMLGKVLYHLQEKHPDGRWKWDRIVMDAPATGHAISFLNVPQTILDTVPPGPMAREAQKMLDLLVDPKVTASVLVSLPEEMPVNETIDLHRALTGDLKIKTGAGVLNMFVAERFAKGDEEAVPPSLKQLVHEHDTREEMSKSAMERLVSELRVPVIPVPRLYEGEVRRRGVEIVMEHLGALWGAEQ